MRFLGMDRFDDWLETELRKADGSSELSTLPAPRYASIEAPRRRRRLLTIIGAVGAAKLALAGGAVVALAAGGLVTAKTVTTGDPNPLDNWGSTVTQQVQTCKADLGANQHGIGQCVSSVAKTHGDSVSDSHANSGSHPNAPASPHPTGPPAPAPGNSGSHTNDAPSGGPPTSREDDHPTPPAHP